MRLWSGDRDRDLALTAALAVLGLIALILPLPHWLAAVVALPLVLALPGYSLTAAIFPPGFITREERWVLTLAFSIVAAALGGLVLQLFVDLDRGVWTGLLLAVTLGACGVAFVRRGPRRRGASGHPLALSPVLVAAFLAAAAICAVAVAIASDGAGDQLARSRFSSLWLLPADRGGTELRVGVENHEGRTVHYTLRVGTLQRAEREWTFVLPSGETWSRRTPGSRFGVASFAALYRGETLFRRVAYLPRGPR